MSLAALELAYSGDKTRGAWIIDLALDYGYESAYAFARALKREFGCLPSEARRPGRKLHTFSRLAFTIVLKGDIPMEYRIEKGPSMLLAGLSIRTKGGDGGSFAEVPQLWSTVMKDGRFAALCAKAAGIRVGVCGVCHSCDDTCGDFTYRITVEISPDDPSIPKGWDRIEVPASTWAKFTSHGALSKNFQDVIKRIYSEWFPVSGREHAGTPELEYYPDLPDTEAPDYWCEYWVPLK